MEGWREGGNPSFARARLSLRPSHLAPSVPSSPPLPFLPPSPSHPPSLPPSLRPSLPPSHSRAKLGNRLVNNIVVNCISNWYIYTRRCYCMGAKFSCISSLLAYSYIQQSGRNLQTMNAKNTKQKSAS